MRYSITNHRARLARGARACALAVLSAFALSASALAQGTGAISGRVQNVGTGTYLNNARVAVVGTNIVVFTNDFGEYRIPNAPAGEVTLRAFYTGLDSKDVQVTVPAGGTVAQDISLTNVARYGEERGREDETVTLDEFVISSARETNAQAIAQNEQRFSPNIKNVVSADSFGDVTEGNVGEFMKYLPGVTVEYVAADVRTMSVRGFADNFTSISFDGARMASASSGNPQRAFEFEQVSINNVARVELTKVPTPNMPADALGGAVNMISKSAFERERAELRYRAYVSINDEDLEFWHKTPGPGRDETYKVLPGFDFDYSLPISDTFGIVVTGLSSNQFNEQHRTQRTWNFAQGGATVSDPFLQLYTMQDGPKVTNRDSVSIKADWKIAPHQVLSGSVQYNYYGNFFGNRNLNWDVSSSATPSTAGGQALDWDPTFTHGASGRGSVRHGTSFRDKYGATRAANLQYRFTGTEWEVESGLNASISKSWYRDASEGHFSEVRTTLLGYNRLDFDNIVETRPGTITAYDANGNEIDWHNLQNFRVDTVRSQPVDGRDEFVGGYLRVKRRLDWNVPVSIQTGIDVRRQERDLTRTDNTWNFVGADGEAGTADDNAFAYVDRRYGVDSYWGFNDIQWPDPFALYDAFVTNPTFFAQTATQQRNAARFRIQNSRALNETISAAFVQFETKLMENRLGIVTGVRYEKTKDKGDGPLTNGPGGSVAEIEANWVERGLHVEDSYSDYYPSLHVNYNFTENLVGRFAYARTLGRPDFSNILPLARVNDQNTSADDGLGSIPALTVITNNPGLQPWHGDSFDLSLEYYMPGGGLLSGGVFLKELTDFWGEETRALTQADIDEFHLDPALLGLGMQIESMINIGDARIRGVELNFQQPLERFGAWGRHFNVFLNATKLRLSGPNNADFRNFIEESGSAGITFSGRPVIVMVKFNYRGEQRRGAQTGGGYGASNGFFEFHAPRRDVDVNIEYQFSRRFTLFANARNIFTSPQQLERRNDQSPGFANLYNREEYGVQIAFGLKGTF